jgi:predicted DNA-binding transcriptional regulator YafY
MRAARLLEMLLVLQRRGRMTASELAALLEVSARTILRDVEALSEAGAPIFASPGAGGGIELLDGFQTRLTGLTNDEARCLFLVGQPQVAHRLGLGAPTQAARNKLLAAMAPTLAVEADQLSSWFLHDPDPSAGNAIPHGELRRLASSIRRHRAVELTLAHHRADEPTLTVRPLGLVLKAGSWILVHDGHAGVETIRIDDLRAIRITNRSFAAPTTFDLNEFWRGRPVLSTATSRDRMSTDDPGG